MLSFRVLAITVLAFFNTFLFAQKKQPAPNYLSATKTPDEIAKLTTKIEKAYYLLCGEFSNHNNSKDADNSATVKQEIIAVPMWQEERPGEYWLYFGWFQNGVPEHAITQSIWQITKYTPDTFLITEYRLPNEEAKNYYPLEWQKSKPFSELKPKDLTAAEGCGYSLYVNGSGDFELSSRALCFHPISAKVQYTQLKITLAATQLTFYSSFFAANKEKLPSLPNVSNTGIFYRTDKTEPIYAAEKNR